MHIAEETRTLLYNLCLENNRGFGTKFFILMMMLLVCTVHFKKGSRTNPANYRPISLTSVVCKMLEGLLRDHLMVHLSSHLLLSDHQYGFRKGRSCALQLIDVIDKWTKAIDEGDQIDVAYFDFANGTFRSLLIKDTTTLAYSVVYTYQ